MKKKVSKPVKQKAEIKKKVKTAEEFVIHVQFPNDKIKKEFISVNKDLEIISEAGVIGQPLASHIVFRRKEKKE